ncbi:sugar ABC transporter substrate-binding protein [Nocardiopsis nanhaiensis]
MSTRTSTRLLATTAVAALALTACGRDLGPGDDETRDIVIGWTPPDVTGVFQTATNFFEEAAEDAEEAGFDIEVRTQAPEQHTDYADQIGIIEDYISQNVDVIAVAPADTDTIRPAIQAADEADIPVIMVNLLEEQEDMEIASYIGFDNAEAAAVSAYSVLDYFGGPGVLGEGEEVEVPEDGFLDLDFWESAYAEADEVDAQADGVIIEGIAGTFFSEQRLTGFREVLEEHGDIEIIAEPIAADWDREAGVSAAEDYLTRFDPDELDFIWAASNEMGLGAINVAEREGVLDDSGGEDAPEEGSVSVFTNDVTPESVQAIEDGSLVAETHHGFGDWGWLGTRTAVELACGAEVDQTQDIRPRTAWQGNSDLFYPDPELPEIDWESIMADCD